MSAAQRPILTGYCHSVYTRAARIALIEKGVEFAYEEHDPFTPGAAGPHPFGRVPVLRHGGFTLYETAAITGYVDERFDGPALMPGEAQARARVAQVIGIVDAYGYWPLVRQVYSHAVFRPAFGQESAAEIVARGLEAAPAVLAALEEIAAGGLALSGGFSRADCHLAPMIAAFVEAPEGAEMLARHHALSGWWTAIAGRASMRATQTPLPTRSAGG